MLETIDRSLTVLESLFSERQMDIIQAEATYLEEMKEAHRVFYGWHGPLMLEIQDQLLIIRTPIDVILRHVVDTSKTFVKDHAGWVKHRENIFILAMLCSAISMLGRDIDQEIQPYLTNDDLKRIYEDFHPCPLNAEHVANLMEKRDPKSRAVCIVS